MCEIIRQLAPAPPAPTAFTGAAPVVLFGVVLLLLALYGLGKWGDDTGGAGALGGLDPDPDRHGDAGQDREAEGQEEGGAARATLRLTAKSSRVYVCLVDATGKAVVNGDYLEPARAPGPSARSASGSISATAR